MNQVEVTTITEMIGVTFVNVVRTEDTLTFITKEGKAFCFQHHQDCCESVVIDDVVGDLDVLKGSPILIAEEVVSEEGENDYGNFATWTFYKFATILGYVDVKFYGTSNGYYSERVSYSWI